MLSFSYTKKYQTKKKNNKKSVYVAGGETVGHL